MLGVMYFNGQGVEQDYARAFELYTQAADKGSPWAPYNLGDMYRLGKGVNEDREMAIKWYRKAASLGNEEAKKALADLGVSQ
jgi:TPR repeat protein